MPPLAVVDVGFGIAGLLSGAVAALLFAAARRHPEAVAWRTRLFRAPRLLATVFALLAAAWATLCAARLAFQLNSTAQGVTVAIAWLLFVAAAVTHLKWLRRVP
jgi:hypothetical protein